MSAEAAEERKPLLVFLNEVAGGRKLLQAVPRARRTQASLRRRRGPAEPAAVGQLIDTGELRDAARARVEVTMAILAEFGIESVGEVMDPDPALALDDAVRATSRASPALLPLRDPLRASRARTWSSGRGAASSPRSR